MFQNSVTLASSPTTCDMVSVPSHCVWRICSAAVDVWVFIVGPVFFKLWHVICQITGIFDEKFKYRIPFVENRNFDFFFKTMACGVSN